jgi:hypothetical protein
LDLNVIEFAANNTAAYRMNPYDNRLPGERVRVERRQEQRSLRDIVDRRELARG